MKLLSFFTDYNQKRINSLKPLVLKINSLEDDFKKLSNEELKQKTSEFKKRLSDGESLDSILPEAFALVREASCRVLNERHFDVQLLGGILLHQGTVTEMRTGEGKTLVATLPAYLNALKGEGVHIVTVNDYLARRDAAWMGQIYNFLDIKVAVINHDSAFLYDERHTEKELDEQRDILGSYKIFYEYLRPVSRQEAYQADIVYGPNNEFGFDYLRDNLSYNKENLVQRTLADGRFNFAIIDEVDSILIDEARTPLIISAPDMQAGDLYTMFAGIAKKLSPEEDYTVDEKFKSISLTDEGINKVEKMLNIDNIYTEKGIKYVHHLETAVKAKALFELDRDYVVKDEEIVIVDEFTGRLQPGRRWSEGLHQAIEAKEGVRIKEESKTMASITYQNYFRLYRKLSGMTGTAMTSQEEFLKVYNLDTVAVPTNRDSQRKDLPDLIFQTETGKLKALVKTITEINKKGQPILIGTSSIDKNELISKYLEKSGLPHQVLNAKNHEKEGAIIASAGKKASIVVATNMAGRGVDIKLGGPNPTKEEYEEVKSLGGLFVIGTERHEARRIDDQLRGRSGRQGDPGSTQFYISLEDSLMRIFAPDRIKAMMGRFGIAEDEPIQNKFISRAVESAQAKIEGMHFDTRKHLLEYDDVINYQRLTIYNSRRNILLGDFESIEQYLDKGFKALAWPEEEKKKIEDFIQEKKTELGIDILTSALKRLVLQTIDLYWLEHLEAIDYMKSSVRLRAYGQRDPLVEFKKEGLNLFKEMELSIFNQILRTIPNLQFVPKAIEAEEGKPKLANNRQPVGRNLPCPCGSGKKYKKCCGK
ncbi:MAG TPA: preprotein translocase subunit SecA [Candidatus Vogelbacteria bacterium]|mgnify:CR=1 FL=1|nr:preprotein translocase subunit SecA [Candidatus Vogelbacteria bacterium]